MSRQQKLLNSAKKSVELIREVLIGEGNDTVITKVDCNESGDSIIFNLKRGRSLEYNISEISYIFEDDIDGLEIFSKKKYIDIYRELNKVQIETVVL